MILNCKIQPFLLLVLYSLLITGCSTARYPFPEGERREGGGRNYPLSALGIPKGQLPPPGECKVWFPDRPAGQQPPPQSCAAALRDAPLGAWVITHDGDRYKVNIFSRSRRNVIDEVRYYLKQ